MLSLRIPYDVSIFPGLKRYLILFTASLFLLVPLTLSGQNSPVITDIVDQSIPEGGTFAAINLDEVVSDPDNTPDQLTWSYENNVDLLVSIQNHVAVVSTPNSDWNGSETITFTVTDPDLNSASDNAAFNVTAVNDAPVIGKIPDQSILQGGSFDLVYLDNYVTDVDNNLADLTWSVSDNPNLTASIDGLHTATIVPAAGFTGKDNLTFTVTDPGGLQDTDNPAYTVTKVETAPVATDDVFTVAEGGTLSTPAPGVLSNDSDADGDLLSALLVSNPSHSSSFSLNADGSLLYVHDGSETTGDVFRYTPNDGVLSGNEATVTINITPVNDAPVVTDISDQTINEGETFQNIELDHYVSDAEDPNNLLAWAATGNSKLKVAIDATTHVASIAPPNIHWNGAETITFTATDTQNATGSDNATFTVKSVADAPVVAGIPDQTVAEDQPFATIPLDNYVTDPDTPLGDIQWTATGNILLSVNINAITHIATVTAPANWNGSETITFTATDPQNGTGSDPVTFTATPVNDPPVVSGIPDQTIAEGASFLTITLDNYVTDD